MLSDFFVRELDLIVDDELRMMVKGFLDDEVGDWFLTSGASSTGKFHPKFSQGEGGLIRHTKAVVMFAEELLRMSSYSYMKAEYKDFVIAACILHDTRKYGGKVYDKSVYADHGPLASTAFRDYCQKFDYPVSEFLLGGIRSHMGQWVTDREDRPFTSIDRCVHMADYMASRNFIDIPGLMDEYQAVVDTMPVPGVEEDEELPFTFGSEGKSEGGAESEE